jgi:hypothetical protein
MKLYSIRDWANWYENNRSKRVDSVRCVPVSNKLDGEHFMAIMAHPDGAVIFSAFILLLEVASKCNPRGVLLRRNGEPHTALSLAQTCRCPLAWFQTALPYLEQHTDWLAISDVENVTLSPKSDRQVTVTCPSPDGQPGDVHNVTLPRKSDAGGVTFTALRQGVCDLYLRPVDKPWSHADESLLAALARRPGALEEFRALASFRRKLPPAEKQFFPNSVRSLLEKWDDTLDRARMLAAPGRASNQELIKSATQNLPKP